MVKAVFCITYNGETFESQEQEYSSNSQARHGLEMIDTSDDLCLFNGNTTHRFQPEVLKQSVITLIIKE